MEAFLYVHQNRLFRRWSFGIFHADCGGHTSSAAAVWGGVAPAYLSGTPDDCPAGHLDWTFETRTAGLRAALNADPRTAVGARLDRIEVAGRDASGRAEKIVLRGTRTFVVRGEVFREVATRALGVKSIRSTLFTAVLSPENEKSNPGRSRMGRGNANASARPFSSASVKHTAHAA